MTATPQTVTPVPTPAVAAAPRRELRGIWLHDPRGVDWRRVMSELHAAKLNAIFVKFSTGGAAYYPSQVLPGSYHAGRDEPALCLAAARPYGIQVHAWHVCFQMKDAPVDRQERAIREGRVQLNRSGRVRRPSYGVPVLCPSHDWNRQQETRAMTELATRYAFDGVQLDYIRWPETDPCCCANCKKRFARDTRCAVRSWPADVIKGGRFAAQYQHWREQIITRLAGDISAAVRQARPSMKISGAVWSDVAVGRRDYGQNWKAWVDHRYLDFVCPMNYVTDPATFSKRLADQRAQVRNRIPLYVGIGAYRLGSGQELLQQISLARRGGADGWVLFNYDDQFRARMLPWLRQ
ncbi:MAG: family 10 glycosylhydrolase [Verrucomicrobiae bacterium]|nr:family 10 glycosylhydrolase [Verrucomicrobiae bacterium]